MAIDIEWVRENPVEAAKQIDLLSEQRDDYRVAEEHQIKLRQKMQARFEGLEAHVERIKRHTEYLGLRAGESKLADILASGPTATSLDRRDLFKQIEAMDRLADRKSQESETGDDASLKSKQAYAAVCAANESNRLRRQAEGGA
ncbi:hypothetical protein [Vreelandella sp. H-I2]